MKLVGPSDVAQAGFAGTGKLPPWRIMLPLCIVLALALVFVLAQLWGGETWDEGTHLDGFDQQMRVAFSWLTGPAETYKAIGGDLAFYGALPIAPAAAADALLGEQVPEIASWTLHLTAYLAGLATCCFVFATTRVLLPASRVPWFAAASLLLFPLWLGYSLFDYKDVPTALFAVMTLYFSVRVLRFSGRRRVWAAWGVVLASVLIASTKIAALALIAPSWIAMLVVLGRTSPRLLLLMVGAALLGTYLVTPVSWTDPLGFAFDSSAIMSMHSWGGCTLTFLECVGTHSPDWSAARYLVIWFAAQLPLLLLLSIGPMLVWLSWQRRTGLLIAASIVVPLALLALKGSTLYDGLRHVIFVIPIIFIAAAIGFERLCRKGRWARLPVMGLCAVTVAIFIADNISMFPYNYVYFNEYARTRADERTFETEYWGFSLKEAVSLLPQDTPGLPVEGHPPHLVPKYLPADTVAYTPAADPRADPTPRYRVRLTRLRSLASDYCEPIAGVGRRLLFGRWMVLSVVERCGPS